MAIKLSEIKVARQGKPKLSELGVVKDAGFFSGRGPVLNQDSTRRANPENLFESFFPQTSENIRKDKGFFETVSSGATEALSALPKFGLATGDVIRQNDPNLESSFPISSAVKAGFQVLTDPEKQKLLARDEEPGSLRGIVSDPSTAATTFFPAGRFVKALTPAKAAVTGAKIGKFGGDLARAGTISGKVIQGLPSLAKASTIAGTEGLVSGATREIKKFGSGEVVDLSNITKEGAFTAVIPIGLSAGKKAIVGTAKFLKFGIEQLIKAGTGVKNINALKKFGFGFGKGAKELAEASGRETEIGDDLVTSLNTFDPALPASVNKSLDNMPDVNIKSLIDELEKAKIPNAAERSAIKVNEVIDQQIALAKRKIKLPDIPPETRLIQGETKVTKKLLQEGVSPKQIGNVKGYFKDVIEEVTVPPITPLEAPTTRKIVTKKFIPTDQGQIIPATIGGELSTGAGATRNIGQEALETSRFSRGKPREVTPEFIGGDLATGIGRKPNVGETGRFSEKEFITAREYKDLISQYQNIAGNSYGKSASNYIDAMKKVAAHGRLVLRKVAKDSKNPQFIVGMDLMADKAIIKEKLLSKLGGSKNADFNAEALIERIGNMSRKKLIELVEDFEKLYDVKILDDAILAAQAKSLGPSGVPAALNPGNVRNILPLIGFGLGGPLAAAATVAGTSPRVGGGILSTLEGLATGIGIGAKRAQPIAKNLQFPIRRKLSDIFSGEENR